MCAPLTVLVEDFIRAKCAHYRIDYSHDLYHSREVAVLGGHIADNDYRFSARQKEILFLSCMLHDTCDSKYTKPREKAILDISSFLRDKCGVPMAVHDGVLEIITAMSYSQVVSTDGRVRFPPWIVNNAALRDVYHTTREADLLTSYDIKRMIHYKHEKLGLLYPCDIYDDIVDTVDRRMSKLLGRNLFVSPTAKKIAAKLHEELMTERLPALTENDIYDILNRPPAPREEEKILWYYQEEKRC